MRSFIVSDLDGTMLDKNSSRLSPAVISQIKRLISEKNIFCVASGRSYVQLKKIFEPLKSVPIYFICCDGALCIYKEETLFSTPLSMSFDDNEKAIAYGKYLVYANEKVVPFYREVLSAYNGHVLPLSSLKGNEIYKVALKDAPLKEKGGCTKCLSKGGWQEYVATGVDKGMAVKKLQKILGITKEQTLILGDSENDISMTGCGYSILIGKNFRLNKHFDAEEIDFVSAVQNNL
ncbi:MAG: HAD-IIB family hydrolase [Clostridia bacterium]|nr:HAD-IIB family hydrolase [Clostridia bacterium]